MEIPTEIRNALYEQTGGGEEYGLAVERWYQENEPKHLTRDGKNYEDCFAIFNIRRDAVERIAVIDLINSDGFLTHRQGENLDIFGEGLEVREVFADEDKAWAALMHETEERIRRAEADLMLLKANHREKARRFEQFKQNNAPLVKVSLGSQERLPKLGNIRI